MSMKDVMYSFAHDHKKRIVHISDANCGEKYFCIDCGVPMIPVKGTGKRRPHFRHDYDKHENDNCSYETYLHKLGKQTIRECISRSNKFCIAYFPEEICNISAGECPINKSANCRWTGMLKSVNLKETYDICEEEVWIGNLRPDLLLRNSVKDDVPPIFIEICVTHRCSDEKISSGNSIIEIVIEDEDDIKSIVENEFIREPTDRFNDDYNNRFHDKIKFYNFPEEHVCPNENKQCKVNIISLDKWSICRDTALCRNVAISNRSDGRLKIVSKEEISYDLARKIIMEHKSNDKMCIACAYFAFNSVPNKENKCTKRQGYSHKWNDMICSDFKARLLPADMYLNQISYKVFGG